MLEVQRPASGSFDLLGGSPRGCSPTHLDRLKDIGAAERDTAADERSDTAFSAALATSLYSVACAPGHLPAQITSVPHVAQASSWDCGLACAAMCLKAFQLEPPNSSSLQALYPTESVWTIDLAHLLRKFGLSVKYCTLTLGINPGFFLEAYYEHMQSDAFRIQRLFEEARGQGILLSQQSVSDSEIEAFLERPMHLIVALVDKNLLDKDWRHWSEEPKTSPACYMGHYVVVCGYEKLSDGYIIRDPDPIASAMGFTWISRVSFNAARTAFGTDEDLLFISNEHPANLSGMFES